MNIFSLSFWPVGSGFVKKKPIAQKDSLYFFKQLAPHKATAWLATQFCLSLKIKTSTILEYVEMDILMFSFAVLLASRVLFC